MNYLAAPSSGISASLRQATGYQLDFFVPRGMELKLYPSQEDSSAGGLKYKIGLPKRADPLLQLLIPESDS